MEKGSKPVRQDGKQKPSKKGLRPSRQRLSGLPSMRRPSKLPSRRWRSGLSSRRWRRCRAGDDRVGESRGEPKEEGEDPDHKSKEVGGVFIGGGCRASWLTRPLAGQAADLAGAVATKQAVALTDEDAAEQAVVEDEPSRDW
ncbi:hypothetical protein Dimus_019901 [Dionaea muscipula]